jgi:hypothetical protein
MCRFLARRCGPTSTATRTIRGSCTLSRATRGCRGSLSRTITPPSWYVWCTGCAIVCLCTPPSWYVWCTGCAIEGRFWVGFLYGGQVPSTWAVTQRHNGQFSVMSKFHDDEICRLWTFKNLHALADPDNGDAAVLYSLPDKCVRYCGRRLHGRVPRRCGVVQVIASHKAKVRDWKTKLNATWSMWVRPMRRSIYSTNTNMSNERRERKGLVPRPPNQEGL